MGKLRHATQRDARDVVSRRSLDAVVIISFDRGMPHVAFAGRTKDLRDDVAEFIDAHLPCLSTAWRPHGLTRRCRKCGCTDGDCSQCIARTGEPCFWVEIDLCSACAGGKRCQVIGGKRKPKGRGGKAR